MLVDAERRVEQIKAGFSVPGAQHRSKPLSECWAEYLQDMVVRGMTQVYRDQVRDQLERVQRECGWTVLSDVTPATLRKFLSQITTDGKSARTYNLYRDVVGTFATWAVSQGWLAENPVQSIPKAREPKGRKRRPRRAYSIEEFQRLINCPDIPESRRLQYAIAGLSGLRRATLRQLQRRDCDPTGESPVWRIRPDIIKTGWRAPVPMLPECAERLREVWTSTPPGRPFFSPFVRLRTLDRDLVTARIDKVDGEGRSVDFHSFRYFFATLLARALPLQKVRVCMMHKDARTTLGLYVDLGLLDLGEDVWTLPPLLADAAKDPPRRKRKEEKKTSSSKANKRR
jgi:integrase